MDRKPKLPLEIGCSLCSLTEYFMFGLSFKEQKKLSRENAFKLEKEFNDVFYNNYKELSANIICEKSKESVLKYKNIEVKKHLKYAALTPKLTPKK